jgi:hypothetical protein
VTATGDTTSSTPLATNSFDIVVFDGFFGRIGALGVFFTGAAAFLAVVPTDFFFFAGACFSIRFANSKSINNCFFSRSFALIRAFTSRYSFLWYLASSS